MAAAEVWKLDDVLWMMSQEGEHEREKEIQVLVDFHGGLHEFLNYFQTALAMKPEDSGIFQVMASCKESMEARG